MLNCVKSIEQDDKGENQVAEMQMKAGKYQMDERGEEGVTGKAWKFWQQKSTLLPRTTATKTVPDQEKGAKEHSKKDAE
jgi:hypothetical protein